MSLILDIHSLHPSYIMQEKERFQGSLSFDQNVHGQTIYIRPLAHSTSNFSVLFARVKQFSVKW